MVYPLSRTPPVPGKTGQNGELTVQVLVSRDDLSLSKGRVPFLSQGRFWFVLDTVPDKVFLLIVFGPNFIHRHPPPTPENTLLGVGDA